MAADEFKENRGADALWALRAIRGHDFEMMLFACDCVDLVLPYWEKAIPEDDRPRVAIETARSYARFAINAAKNPDTFGTTMAEVIRQREMARGAALDAMSAAMEADAKSIGSDYLRGVAWAATLASCPAGMDGSQGDGAYEVVRVCILHIPEGEGAKARVFVRRIIRGLFRKLLEGGYV